MDDLRIKVAEARGWRHYKDDIWIAPSGYMMKEGDIPSYPHSMDACMELVDEIRGHENLYVEMVATAMGSAYVGIYRFDYDYPIDEQPLLAEDCSITLPKAICMAYLKWKGES